MSWRLTSKHRGVRGEMFIVGGAAMALAYNTSLVVRVASPGYLFAMKVAASRVERDVDDIVALFQMCGFASVDEALDHVTAIYPSLTLEPRAQFLLEEIASITTSESPPDTR